MSHHRLHSSSFCLLVCNWPEFGQILLAAAALAYKEAGTGKVGCFWCIVGTHLVGRGGAQALPSSEWFLLLNHSVTEKHMPSNIDLHFRI